MDAEAIRSLLKASRASMIPTPPGMAAVVQSDVIGAGADPEAVLACVEACGGYEDSVVEPASRSLRPGRPDLEPSREVVPIYVVPEDALRT